MSEACSPRYFHARGHASVNRPSGIVWVNSIPVPCEGTALAHPPHAISPLYLRALREDNFPWMSGPRVTVTTMTSSPSDTQQRNSLSEGVALGLTMLDCWELPHDKVAVDPAFTGAFRSWPHASLFPRVQSDLRSADGTRVMTRVTFRKQTALLFWESGRTLTIHRRIDDWKVDDAGDLEFAVKVVDERLPASAWADLARRFLKKLQGDGSDKSMRAADADHEDWGFGSERV